MVRKWSASPALTRALGYQNADIAMCDLRRISKAGVLTLNWELGLGVHQACPPGFCPLGHWVDTSRCPCELGLRKPSGPTPAQLLQTPHDLWAAAALGPQRRVSEKSRCTLCT
jgi:hypothetical protein